MTKSENNIQFTLLKIPIQEFISKNEEFDLKSKLPISLSLSPREEKPYYIDLGTSLLFDQIERIRGYASYFIEELIFLIAPRNPKTEPVLKHMIRNGFIYNGIHYSRFGKSASQSKEGITAFVATSIYNELLHASQMDIEIDKCVISKYEAQRCLIFSSCTLIKNYVPNIVIVDEFSKTIPNQFIRYVKEVPHTYIDKDTGKEKTYIAKEIEEEFRDIDISPFDGCGCHSLEFAQKIGEVLGLDYIPYGSQIRMPYVKGYSVYVPFKEYYRSIGVTHITDVYGKEHDIESIDAIWNTTMFKAHKLFKQKYGAEAWNEYIKTFKKYDYKIGISKYSHHVKDLNLKARMNFQYIQTLDLWNEDYINHGFDKNYDILSQQSSKSVVNLARYTTNLFENIIKGDKFYTLKFMGIGDTAEYKSTSKYIDAVMTNDIMLKDPAIKKFIYTKLTKYIQEAKVGKIYADGFYHTIIGDMIGYLEFVAGREVKGCIQAKEFYCGTLRQGSAVAFRSPLVCPSEVNDVTIVSNEVTEKWLSHIKDQDIVMVNMYDISLPQMGGAD